MFKIIKLRRGFTEIEDLFNYAQSVGLYICGGYARYCASPKNKPVDAGDIDLFPSNLETFDSAKQKFMSDGLEVKNENDVSLTFKIPSDSHHIWRNVPQIQLIKPMIEAKIVTYGSPEEILQNFDFTITRACIISKTEVLADKNFEEDELKNNLRFMNIHCPISSMFRAIKYIKKGYWMSPVEAINLFHDWTGRTDEYRNKIVSYLEKVEKHKEDGEDTLTEEELFEFERLMKID